MYTDVEQHTQGIAGRLRQLPPELVPPYDWEEFRRRSRPTFEASRAAIVWRHAALAATVIVAIMAVVVWSRIEVTPSRTVNARPSIGNPQGLGRPLGEEPLENASPLPSPAPERQSAAELSQAGDPAARAARSRALEHWLAAMPQEPAVVRVGTRAAVTGLEDQLAQVDDLLTSMRLDGAGRERLVMLQQERTRLIGSLAQVRYAEAVDARTSP